MSLSRNKSRHRIVRDEARKMNAVGDVQARGLPFERQAQHAVARNGKAEVDAGIGQQFGGAEQLIEALLAHEASDREQTVRRLHGDRCLPLRA